MGRNSFLLITAAATAAVGIYYAYRYLSSDNQKNKKKNKKEKGYSADLNKTIIKTSISLEKFIEILKEVNKEFVKEQFMRDKYKTLKEYPQTPEFFLNRQIYPKVEEAYARISDQVYKKYNVEVDEVDQTADAYIDVPEVAEEMRITSNYFSLFSPETQEKEEDEEKLVLPPELTLEILREELDMYISCLHKATDEVCKKENINESELGKKLHESEDLMKEYTNIYTRMITNEEEKLFNKYDIQTKNIQLSVIKHQNNPSFFKEFQTILERRKIEYSKYGLDG